LFSNDINAIQKINNSQKPLQLIKIKNYSICFTIRILSTRGKLTLIDGVLNTISPVVDGEYVDIVIKTGFLKENHLYNIYKNSSDTVKLISLEAMHEIK